MNKKNILIIFLLTLFLLNFIFKSNVLCMASPESKIDYDNLWKEAQGYISKGLPKSALIVVEKIYQAAKRDKDAAETIKSLIYKCYYIQQVEEETFVKIQKELNDELKSSEFPITPLLHSMIAELYWKYYLDNRYRFLDRTQISQFNQEDMRTWDLNKIVEMTCDHYDKSLKEKDRLKITKITIFDKILIKGNTQSLRPTLYDFLVHRAIDFYSNQEAGLTKPVYEFNLNKEDYLAEADKFISLEITSKDTLSFDFKAIIQLQEVLKFHAKDLNPEAFVDADLKRMEFVYNKTILSNRDAVYEKILKKMTEKYKESPVISEISFKLAKFYHQQGIKYNPFTNEASRWKLKDAYKICNNTIKKHNGTYGADSCTELMDEITARNFTFTMEKAVPADKPFLGLLSYKNIGKVYIKIVKTSREELTQKRNLYNEEILKIFLDKRSLKDWSVNIPDERDFQNHTVEINFDKLKPGEYALFISDDDDFNYKEKGLSYSFFTVTNLCFIQRNNNEKGLEFTVFDRDTGKPLDKVTVQTWYEEYSNIFHKYFRKEGNAYLTDSTGSVCITKMPDKNNYFWVEFIKDNDGFMTENNYSVYKSQEYNSRTVTYFFTDRAIYRPGQTVFFKGITLALDLKDGQKTKILPGSSTNVILYDVNHQKVSELNLMTNEYGTFSGSFQLKKGLLNGEFTISNSFGSSNFSVEEYKRPKFYVGFKDVSKEYKLNEKICLKGEAKGYAGFNIDNAHVKYRVVRSTYYPYRWYCYYVMPTLPEMEILNGTGKTDANGEFEIQFNAIPDLTVDPKFKPAFNFTVYVDVTDLNGETRSSEKTISVGYSALLLSIGFSEEVDKEINDYPFNVNTTNMSNEFVKAAGELEIFKLAPVNDKIFRKRVWNAPDQYLKEMTEDEHYKNFPNDAYKNEDDFTTWKKEKRLFSEKFDTAKSLNYVLKNMKSFETGKYVIEMTSKDRFGVDVKEVKYFTLYSNQDNKVPYKLLDWFCAAKNSVEPGDKAIILIGSSDKDVNVIYETEHKGEIIDKKILILNNEQKKIEIPIEEKHRGNLNLNFTFVKHNRFFNHPVNIYVPWSNKELKVGFETFRNKLMPGEKENWRIKISGKNKEKIAAEMVATLYDASLDTFRPNSFSFSPFPSHYLKNNWNHYYVFDIINSQSQGILREYHSVRQKVYDSLNWFNFYLNDYYQADFDGGGVAGIKGQMMMRKSSSHALSAAPPMPMLMAEGKMQGKDHKVVQKKEKRMESDIKADQSIAYEKPAEAERSEGLKKGNPADKDIFKVKARTDFNETAFFYPNLLTDENGNVIISFKIPESLTKWKMLGFSHSKNLEYGFVQNELITQKTLMVVPNSPRFFRENDKMVFTSKVTNLGDSELSGDAVLQFFDAQTMEPIDVKFKNSNNSRSFTAKKGQSALLSWNIEIPEDVDTATYRVLAKSGSFSDGEEQAVPILKNRMMVSETMPLPVRSNQTKEFKFERLLKTTDSNTLKPYKLTLEFTSNPVWYAVLALPYIMEYPYECIEQTFSRFYANSIASYIANANPKIKKIFDLWKNSPNSNALLSNLEKNQELKTVLLEETPWVMDAKNETERKKRISILFDLNRVEEELNRALGKILEEQLPSGGWTWFKGMRENRYITQHLISGFAHLDRLKVKNLRQDERVWSMLQKAIFYLDKKLKEDYDWLVYHKINLKQNNLSSEQIHYLYARSYFPDIKVDESAAKAFEYYKKQIKKYWLDENIYLQGMIALSLKRYGDNSTPHEISKSIKEHAIYSDEMGMYWKQSYGYYWYQAPIETHALMIEMFSEIENDQKVVDDLKTWLLKSKQTQDWKTTKATAEACYALLLRGEDWLYENKPADITVGKNKIEPSKLENTSVEAGTGYFKTSWTGSEIIPEMGNITVKNNNKVCAWGGVYFQYFENLDKISASDTPLKLSTKLFIEKPSDTGPVLIPIKSEKIRIGDRVKVRIELRVDRDMEFVHMKDMRASTFEPENVISCYKWQDGLGYYESVKDASTNFFFDYLKKGTYVFEYPLKATHEGDFSNGITSVQCMYAPEFSSHSEGVRVKIIP